MQRAIAASFVVTLPLACAASAPEGGGVRVFGSGQDCFYAVLDHCPDGELCNPPPPRRIECPPDLGGPPAQRRGWVRIKEELSCYQGKCSYQSDAFCPYPAQNQSQCTDVHSQEVHAEPFDPARTDAPPGGLPDGAWVGAFTAQRANGSCSLYEGFWCNPGACELPSPQLVSCTAPPPLPAPPRPTE